MKPAVARPRIRSFVAFATSFACLVLGTTMLMSPPTSASDPESQTVRLTPEPGVKTYNWTGEIPIGVTGLTGLATTSCLNDPQLEDVHVLEVQHTKSRLYREVNVEMKITIRWEEGPILNDNALALYGPDGGVITTSDGGEPFESVVVSNVDEGKYTVVACGFTNTTPTPYVGSVELNTTKRRLGAAPAPTVPTAPSNVGGSSGSGSGGSALPFAPTAPAVTVPPPRLAPGAGRVATPFATPTTVPVSEAAPAAFQGLEEQGVLQQAPQPVETISEETADVPWWIAVVVIAAGVMTGAYGLFERRRRQLDVPPSSSLVPVAG